MPMQHRAFRDQEEHLLLQEVKQLVDAGASSAEGYSHEAAHEIDDPGYHTQVVDERRLCPHGVVLMPLDHFAPGESPHAVVKQPDNKGIPSNLFHSQLLASWKDVCSPQHQAEVSIMKQGAIRGS